MVFLIGDIQMKRTIVIGLIILTLFPGAQASIFDDLRNILTPVQTPAITQQVNGFDAFLTQMYKLNTPEAIESLNAEMDDYGVSVLKVGVTKLPWNKCENCLNNFYVVRGVGVVSDYPTNDREVVLTYSQVMRMYPYFEDGKLDFFDRWQVFAIWKMG